MEQVRVLLLEVPHLLREILEQAIQVDDECELVTDPDVTATFGDRIVPDVVVLGLTAEGDATLVPALLARWPRARVVTVMPHGDAATIYELRPDRRMLDEMSPTEIVNALRHAVRCGRRGSTGAGEDEDARAV
jgi:DNA-binding NarL/FixJ family response regulator